MRIRSLEDIDFDHLFRGFKKAFSDYEIRFDKEEVRCMLVRRGYNPRLSFGAFDGDEMVAFTLNGIGLFNDIRTAYDTGTGTVAEYRGRGLAGEIFAYSLPYLRGAGVRQYLLEVLQNNRKAIAVYRRMKFEITRELDCFRQTIADISFPAGGNEGLDCRIDRIGIESVKGSLMFGDFSPSWQNNIESIERGAANLVCLGAFIGGNIAGYCVFDPDSGDLTQIAVEREYRERGIGSRLLREAVGRMRTDVIKVLNIAAENTTLPAFLKRRNIVSVNKQFEMILPL